MSDVRVAVFGDCVSHGICSDYKHTRTIGLMNWYSMMQKERCCDDRYDKDICSLDRSNYEKRILNLDLTKSALNYLLEEKADYLVLDPNDCRMRLCMVDQFVFSCSVPGKHLFDLLDEEDKKIVNAYEIEDEKYIEAADVICREILKVYEPNQIIINEHKIVDEYTDGEGWFYFCNEKNPSLNKRAARIIDIMYEYLFKRLEGCHVIEFPEYVIGDKFHRFGACGLHYVELHKAYGKECLKIIFEKHQDESQLLKMLKNQYSLMFKMMKDNIKNTYRMKCLEKRFDMFQKSIFSDMDKRDYIRNNLKNISDVNLYMDMLLLYGEFIGILLAVKDTPGFSRENNALGKLFHLDICNYPNKLWGTYCGIIVKKAVIVDITSGEAEIPTIWESNICGHSVHLESHSFRKLNQAKIEIDNKDYAVNRRGVNIVVVDANTFEIIDSVVYDARLFYKNE